MKLLDVNVLVYAHRAELPDHERFRAWLEALRAAPSAFGVTDPVLKSFLRVVTNRRIFRPATPIEDAIAFVEGIVRSPACVRVAPGPRQWAVFLDLCRRIAAHGDLVTDAYHAAVAMELGHEWITTDRDLALFPGLRWRGPFDARARINPE